MRKKDVLLVGGFHEIIELCDLCDKRVVGIIDHHLKGDYFGCKVLGGDEVAPHLYRDFGDVPVVVVPDSPKVRRKLVEYYSNIGFKFASLISPKAEISTSVKIGKGVVVQNHVNLSSLVTIGDFVKLNSFANIMHDSFVGDYVTIAPNAVILGRVRILDSSYIGANATILPDVTVGRNSIVGAGSVIAKNISEETMVIRNSTKKYRRKMK